MNSERGSAIPKASNVGLLAGIIGGGLSVAIIIFVLGPDAALPIGILSVSIVVILFGIEFIKANNRINERRREEQRRKTEMFNALVNGVREITVNEFFSMRNCSTRNLNFSGVYVLLNQTRNMYYVGQSIQIMDRVHSHFTGKGNGDVYADYKYGNSFVIKLIRLESRGYGTLDELERECIARYDAYSRGYNKTRGNY